jgi:hypothetical protein
MVITDSAPHHMKPVALGSHGEMSTQQIHTAIRAKPTAHKHVHFMLAATETKGCGAVAHF